MGSNRAINYLRHIARTFIFQTALSPPTVAAAMEGINIIKKDGVRRKMLREKVESLTSSLKELGFKVTNKRTAIISLQIGDSKQANYFSKRLLEVGIYIPAIRPPTVPLHTSRLRITLMATHSQQQLERLVHSLAAIGVELGIIKKK